MHNAVLSGVALAALCLAPLTGAAQAIIPGGAQAEAQARLVCGSGTVLGATYLPGGLLQVTCRANIVQQSSTTLTTASQLPPALQGTALVPTATAGVLTVVVVATIIGGDDATSTTTTAAEGR